MTDVLITAVELADLLKSEPCVVIDTRNPDAYAAGHLPNAVNVHEILTFLATSTPEGMAELKTKFADAFGGAGLSGKETAVIYEQSMMFEKLNRLADMERLLRRVIELKPDHQQAYNALGYSLAERNLRLPEARSLRAAGRLAEAAAVAREALELWRGTPLADIADNGWAGEDLRRQEPADRLRLLQRSGPRRI